MSARRLTGELWRAEAAGTGALKSRDQTAGVVPRRAWRVRGAGARGALLFKQCSTAQSSSVRFHIVLHTSTHGCHDVCLGSDHNFTSALNG